jgi:hypothetical protein
MPVETPGEAYSYGWRVTARCAAGKRDGVNRHCEWPISPRLGHGGLEAFHSEPRKFNLWLRNAYVNIRPFTIFARILAERTQICAQFQAAPARRRPRFAGLAVNHGRGLETLARRRHSREVARPWALCYGNRAIFVAIWGAPALATKLKVPT